MMQAKLTNEEEKACELLGNSKSRLLAARQRQLDALTEDEKEVIRMTTNDPNAYIRLKNYEAEHKMAMNSLSFDELNMCHAFDIDPVTLYREKVDAC